MLKFICYADGMHGLRIFTSCFLCECVSHKDDFKTMVQKWINNFQFNWRYEYKILEKSSNEINFISKYVEIPWESGSLVKFWQRLDAQKFRDEGCGKTICVGKETYGKVREAIIATFWSNTENRLDLVGLKELCKGFVNQLWKQDRSLESKAESWIA